MGEVLLLSSFLYKARGSNSIVSRDVVWHIAMQRWGERGLCVMHPAPPPQFNMPVLKGHHFTNYTLQPALNYVGSLCRIKFTLPWEDTGVCGFRHPIHLLQSSNPQSGYNCQFFPSLSCTTGRQFNKNKTRLHSLYSSQHRSNYGKNLG